MSQYYKHMKAAHTLEEAKEDTLEPIEEEESVVILHQGSIVKNDFTNFCLMFLFFKINQVYIVINRAR